jgi:hypothetical protein
LDPIIKNADIGSNDEAAPKIIEEVEVELAMMEEYENNYESSVLEHRERVVQCRTGQSGVEKVES